MLPALIVVTDLDATLLDHFDYSYLAAEPALNRLHELGIPLVLNSSKTMAELLEIRQQLGLQEPFIVENGAGLIIPEGKILKEHSFGMNRAELLAVIHDLREKHAFKFTGFADMSPQQVSEQTGLSVEASKLALQRQFTEVLNWQDSDEHMQDFQENLQSQGLNLIRGGRFWHVSAQADKGKATAYIRDYYQKKMPERPMLVALGDSENDLPMLELADFPVLVKSPVKDFPEFRHPGLRKTLDYGPSGWNQAVLAILQELGNNQD